MVYTATEIAALIAGCCNNQRICQQKLYNFLHPFVAQICCRYANNLHDAEDLLNESFIKMFKSIQDFKAVSTNDIEPQLKGWLKKIAVNTCIDFLRRKKSIIFESEEQMEIAAENVYQPSFGNLAYKDILSCIGRLSPTYKTIFNLHVIEGYSHEEIAGLLHITVGASKSSLNKAKNNLKKMLQQYGLLHAG